METTEDQHKIIDDLNREIIRLETEQHQLESQLKNINDKNEELDQKITDCCVKLRNLESIKRVFDNFDEKSNEIKNRIFKVSLKTGVFTLVPVYFIGGGLADATIGSIIGVSLAVGTIVSSGIATYFHKTKSDKLLMTKYDLNDVRSKIKAHEREIEHNKAQQQNNNKNIPIIKDYYCINNRRIQELRLQLSLIEPNESIVKRPKVYCKVQ